MRNISSFTVYFCVFHTLKLIENSVKGKNPVLFAVLEGMLTNNIFFSVGEFEADALLVPDGCKFEHLHKSNKCQSHDQWKVKAAAKCKAQGKHLNDYGVLLPCDVDKFTGIEFVCCPRKHKKNKTIQLTPTATPTESETPTTPGSELEKLVAKFEESVPEKSVGMCFIMQPDPKSIFWVIFKALDIEIDLKLQQFFCLYCIYVIKCCGTYLIFIFFDAVFILVQSLFETQAFAMEMR